MTPDTKPGWQTSEFWVTIAMQVLSVLVLTGAIAVGDRTTLEGAVTNGIQAAVALIASAATIWRYVASREAVKTKQLETQATIKTGVQPMMKMLPPH